MGAVSTRGARRERRLAKRNSQLYGPRGALLSAQNTELRHGRVQRATGQFLMPR
jgi:hypothetical protein